MCSVCSELTTPTELKIPASLEGGLSVPVRPQLHHYDMHNILDRKQHGECRSGVLVQIVARWREEFETIARSEKSIRHDSQVLMAAKTPFTRTVVDDGFVRVQQVMSHIRDGSLRRRPDDRVTDRSHLSLFVLCSFSARSVSLPFSSFPFYIVFVARDVGSLVARRGNLPSPSSCCCCARR